MHELKAKRKDVKGANPSPNENSDILFTFILLFSFIVFNYFIFGSCKEPSKSLCPCVCVFVFKPELWLSQALSPPMNVS